MYIIIRMLLILRTFAELTGDPRKKDNGRKQKK